MTKYLFLVLAILTAITGLLGGVWGYGESRYRQGAADGAAKVVRETNQSAAEQAKDAEAARQPALEPGSLARLRAGWCRDCTP